ATRSPARLRRDLTDAVLPRLSAAAHGTIALYQLPRVAPRSRVMASSVRGIVREIARHPDWSITWPSSRVPRGAAPSPAGGVEGLVEPLLGPAPPGDPGSTFIFPTMSRVESSGLALDLLGESTRAIGVTDARRALLRAAAWSMLQDTPDHAPYGWSHCLTLPQAALGIAGQASDPSTAIAVAATYVLGFRATLGRVTLDPRWSPAPSGPTDVLDALRAGPAEAAAAVWHACADDLVAITARLATAAAVHPDAHLAKYTLACFDAAHADPGAGRLYLAAAAFLGAWWAQLPLTHDPLLG
ncbi:MAG TPA: hypothetical protein VIJ47_04400, partial [Acidimicrobiales bacterium]